LKSILPSICICWMQNANSVQSVLFSRFIFLSKWYSTKCNNVTAVVPQWHQIFSDFFTAKVTGLCLMNFFAVDTRLVMGLWELVIWIFFFNIPNYYFLKIFYPFSRLIYIYRNFLMFSFPQCAKLKRILCKAKQIHVWKKK
jgi:hypothetical protein